MTALFCPNCGARLKEGQHFCMRCGCDIKEWADVLEDGSEEHVAHTQGDRLATAPQTKGDDTPSESDAGATDEELASAVPEDDKEVRHAAPEDAARGDGEPAGTEGDEAGQDGEPTDLAGEDAEPADPAGDTEPAGPAGDTHAEEAKHAAPEDVARGDGEPAGAEGDEAGQDGEPTDLAGEDAEPADPAGDTRAEEAKHAAPEDVSRGDGEPVGPEEEDEEAPDPAEGEGGPTGPAGEDEEAVEPATDAQTEVLAQEHEGKDIPTDSEPTSPLNVIPPDPAAISLLPVSRHHPRLYKEESKAGHRHVLIFAFLTLTITVAVLALSISSCQSKNFTDPQAGRVVPGGYHDDSDAPDGSGQSPLAAEKAAKDRERDRQAVQGLYDELADLDEQVSACEAAYNEHYIADRDTRSGDSEIATQLVATIQKAQQQAKRTSIEGRSDYYDQYQLELTCYQCLIERMNLVTQMWARNLKYNNPQNYVEKLREIRVNAIREGETDVAPKVDYNRAYSEISL